MSLNIVRQKARVLEVWTEGTTNVSWKLELPQPMPFKPGQFVMVAFDGIGSKAMSMASSPTRPFMELLAEMSESAYKKRWAEVREGDFVTIVGPYGVFTLNESEQKIGFVAGGIGITPFKSMLEYVQDKKLETDVVLLYSNKTPELIACKKELDELAAANPRMRVVYTITRPDESTTQWSGLTGRINLEMIEQTVPDWRERLWYVCAGDAMVKDMCALLEGAGLEKKRVRREVFTGVH